MVNCNTNISSVSTPRMKRICQVFVLPGRTPYRIAWQYMKVLLEHKYQSRKQGVNVPDYLLVVEHSSVYTLGKGGSMDNLLFPDVSVLI